MLKYFTYKKIDFFVTIETTNNMIYGEMSLVFYKYRTRFSKFCFLNLLDHLNHTNQRNKLYSSTTDTRYEITLVSKFQRFIFTELHWLGYSGDLPREYKRAIKKN